jgi:outer membrane protein OmpA-like peptidoglycan-associated protein
VRAPLLAAIASLASLTARAEPRPERRSSDDQDDQRAREVLELSGFVGVSWFGARSSLGNAWAPEQVPGTSPLIGARIGLALPTLPANLQLALEGELGFAPAFTGASAVARRMSYFAPVFEWHAHAVLRLVRWRAVEPHIVLGGGGETVTSSSPFMAEDSDPVAYWGLGARVPALADWHVRADARHGIMPARGGGATSTFEIQLGLGTAFGSPAARAVRPVVAAPVEPPAVDDTDGDGDGIPDRLDRCPAQRETVNGVADDDGCAEPDPDSDGILADADRCPDQAEDFDRFDDGDGCPDPDNDGDGVTDLRDACPAEPEAVNAFEDDDGCPDAIPADVAAALATVVRFEPGRARVTDPARAALARMLAMLQAWPALHLAIVGHPDRADPAADDLARRRADAVKWYLVDQGIPEDRISTSVGAVAARAPATAFELAAKR